MNLLYCIKGDINKSSKGGISPETFGILLNFWRLFFYKSFLFIYIIKTINKFFSVIVFFKPLL